MSLVQDSSINHIFCHVVKQYLSELQNQILFLIIAQKLYSIMRGFRLLQRCCCSLRSFGKWHRIFEENLQVSSSKMEMSKQNCDFRFSI